MQSIYKIVQHSLLPVNLYKFIGEEGFLINTLHNNCKMLELFNGAVVTVQDHDCLFIRNIYSNKSIREVLTKGSTNINWHIPQNLNILRQLSQI